MSRTWLGIYGGFFVMMVLVALVVTGVLQQGILPRVIGQGAEETVEPEPSRGESGEAAWPQEGKRGEGPRAAGGAAESPVASGPGPGAPDGRPAEGNPPQASSPAESTSRAAATDSGSPGRPGVGMDQAAKGGREAPGEPAGRVKRLARLYEGMRAKEAAAVLERLERPLAMRILSLLSERQAGKILSAMNPSAAAEVSRLLGQATLEREVRAHEQ